MGSAMQQFEYKVVPAPVRGEKVKGARRTPERFAHALGALMNQLARDGWEYLRADTLPCEERTGLTGKTTTFQNMLVFRRALTAALPIPDGAQASAHAPVLRRDHSGTNGTSPDHEAEPTVPSRPAGQPVLVADASDVPEARIAAFARTNGASLRPVSSTDEADVPRPPS